MKKTTRSGASARWITVFGSAGVALAIWTAVIHSPSATQSAAPAATPTADANFGTNDTFLTQPYVQNGASYSQPIPQGSTIQSYPTRTGLRSRGS